MLIIATQPEKTKTGTIATKDQVKKQLNIPLDFTDDDDVIADYLAVAIEAVEDDTKSDILDVANILTHDITRENAATTVPSIIYVYQAPTRAVSKIETLNGATWAEIPATAYKVEILFNRFEVKIFETYTAEKIRFTFTTGFEDTKCPKQLQQAVILKAADLFGPERSNYATTAITNINTYLRLINKHVRTYW